MRHFVLLALAACASPPPPPPPAPASPQIAKIGEHQVDIIVAHERFATLTEDELRAGTRLDLFVTTHPYTTWTSIELRGPDREPTTLLDPATSYTDLVPRVRFAPNTQVLSGMERSGGICIGASGAAFAPTTKLLWMNAV